MDPRDRKSRIGLGWGRLLVVSAMGLVAVGGYYRIRSNGEGAHSGGSGPAAIRPVRIAPRQEIAIGLQAAPAMAQRYGGLSSDQRAQRRVDRVCHDLVEKTDARRSPYDFDCHVLADPRTVDAFSLPGGQVFVTAGLLAELPSDGGLAKVLGREIGHVLARHATERLAGVRIAPGVTGGAVLAGYDPGDPASRRKASALVGRLLGLRFSPQEEAEADRLGGRLAAQAGYGGGEGAERLRPPERLSSRGR
jgi:predicted Zn-dependent protease